MQNKTSLEDIIRGVFGEKGIYIRENSVCESSLVRNKVSKILIASFILNQ
jgi:hypothetical protein